MQPGFVLAAPQCCCWPQNTQIRNNGIQGWRELSTVNVWLPPTVTAPRRPARCPVMHVPFSPDGQSLARASDDGIARVWTFGPGRFSDRELGLLSQVVSHKPSTPLARVFDANDYGFRGMACNRDFSPPFCASKLRIRRESGVASDVTRNFGSRIRPGGL